MHPPHEGIVQVLAQVGRQDRDPLVLFHLLQQVTDLDIRIAVVRVFDLGTLAEERIGFVEEKNRAARLGLAKNVMEVLLGLADIFADDLREVNLIKIKM
jgi:hypothetical protein